MRMVNRDKIRRFFILFALLGVVVLLVGPGVRWERFGLSGSVRVAPGLYLVDSRNVSRLEGLPGVAVGEEVAGKRLVRIASSISLPSPIKVQPYPKEARLAPELKTDGDKRPDPLVVNVTLFSPDEKKKVAAAVAAAGGTVLRGLDEEDAATLRVKVPRAAVRKLAAEKGVVWIEPYAPRRFLVDRAAAVTGTAPLLSPGFVTAAGLSGSGQMVGVADNGLDKGSLDDLHPDFGSTPGRMPKVVMLRSWVGGPLGDRTGHGTHVAGTIAGTGAASGGRYRGIAPGSSIYFQAIVNAQGEPDPPADLISLFRPAYSAGVRVHVDGWGGGKNGYTAAAAQIDRFCYYNPDFLPVFGAGNSGPTAGSITAEANSKNALVVGAAENPRPLFGYTGGKVAGFSSRGPAGDGRLKPDLVAPGAGVIAPRSRLAPSPPGQGYYRQLDGTSMAAAVAGGAAVLLREYLQREEGLTTPPAALLKALLINGAHKDFTPAGAGGFGELDLAATVLALRERTFRYVVAPGLKEKESAAYEVAVTDGIAPLKVTLCWTDPPALPGAGPALVCDLDLVVVGPDGRRYLGNDFVTGGAPDRLNNVEQVTIPRPVPGRYLVTVTAVRVGGGAASGQAFALAYGQVPRREIVEDFANGRVRLSGDGGELVLPREVVALVNGRRVAPEEALGPGTDIYLIPGKDKVYAVGEKRVVAPASFLGTEKGAVVVSESGSLPDGGYLLRPAQVRVGDAAVAPAAVPSGVRAELGINPATQTVWTAYAAWVEKKGFLAAIETTKVALLNGESYPLAPGCRISREAGIAGLDPLDRPFGPPEPAGELPAGLPVTLRLDPGSGAVLHVAVQQELVSGFIGEVSGATLTFEDGRSCSFFPGAGVNRGEKLLASAAALEPGEHLTGVVLPGKTELLHAWADSGFVYGEILFLDAAKKTVHLQDVNGDYRILELAPGAGFFCGPVSLSAAALFPGEWVRLQTGPDGRVVRADLSGGVHQTAGVIEGFDSAHLILSDGTAYQLSSRSLLLKNGWPVTVDDFRAGEHVTVTFWEGSGSLPVALAVKAETNAPRPILEIAPHLYGKPLQGRTSGTRLYVYPGDGRRLTVAVYGGEFAYAVGLRTAGAVRVVSVDERTGGVNGSWVELSGPRTFSDVAASWAAQEITALAAAGFLCGYPDGTFRPNAPVTRVELAVLAARLWPGMPCGPVPADAPAWARDAVRLAVYRGTLPLSPGGLFHPAAVLDRVAVAAALASLLPDEAPGGAVPPFRDWAKVPVQAREAVAELYTRGILRGRPDGRFDPFAPLTRAEAAALFYRLRYLPE